jgi:two-component sensor histidine kinase
MEPRYMHVDSAQAILDAVDQGLVLLDPALHVAYANRWFRERCGVLPEAVGGRPLYEFGDGQWDTPALRRQLEHVAAGAMRPEHIMVEIGVAPDRRIFKLSARKLEATDRPLARILLTIEDVTAAVGADRHKDLLAAELAHRVNNALSLISSFVALEMRRTVEPCRSGYREMETRLRAVAGLYDVIAGSNAFGPVNMQRYLDSIAQGLGDSFVGRNGAIRVVVDAEPLAIGADQAVPLGLLVNELATNAIKHAFPAGRGTIVLGFGRRAGLPVLSVKDDGVGLQAAARPGADTAMGMRFVDALVHKVGGTLARVSGSTGTSVEIRLPETILA